MATKSTVNKTPYELRFDILEMSKDYFQRINDVNLAFAQEAFQMAVGKGKASYSDWEKFVPKAYSFDEVIEKAQELYGFVNKKD